MNEFTVISKSQLVLNFESGTGGGSSNGVMSTTIPVMYAELKPITRIGRLRRRHFTLSFIFLICIYKWASINCTLAL